MSEFGILLKRWVASSGNVTDDVWMQYIAVECSGWPPLLSLQPAKLAAREAARRPFPDNQADAYLLRGEGSQRQKLAD